jgi:hypothetical protein
MSLVIAELTGVFLPGFAVFGAGRFAPFLGILAGFAFDAFFFVETATMKHLVLPFL